jgi:hypothetical protein
MKTTFALFVVTLVVTLLTLAPTLLMSNPVDAASSPYYCRDYPGKSQDWINGCQQGWWDHNHCYTYNADGESNAFASGYKVGWNKGLCKFSPHNCTEYQGKSSSWKFGCQNGWWDHDHCQSYNPESGQYAHGYSVGWAKGHCK